MNMVVRNRDDDVTHVVLEGRLDALGLHEVDLRFHGETAARGRPTIVDLTGVEFIGSLGIGMLIGCAKSLRHKGAKMALVSREGPVALALRKVGIHEVIPMVRNEEEALVAVRREWRRSA